MDVFEVMRTQRSVKRFRSDPVDRADIEKMITAATWAPNGSNRQAWEFIVVDDAGTKKALADVYRDAWNLLYEQRSTRRSFHDPRTAPAKMMSDSKHLCDHLEEAPVLILVCMDTDRNLVSTDGVMRMYWEEGNYTSTLPGVQNLMIAARALGIGTCLTTALNVFGEKAKDILDLPDALRTIALIPVGYPEVDFRPVNRIPAEESTHWNRWGNPTPSESG